MLTERIYYGHDNTIDRILKSDGVAVDLNLVTKIGITIGGVTFESSDKAAGVITWDQVGYDTGEIRIDIGNELTLLPLVGDIYDCEITVFDASHTKGIAWDTIRVEVLADYY